ncbi:TPA: fatty acid metabolism transcriptional regulator FadR, partial [Mannheimia haemolytica]|nr:fatty acid metabolism transcriptional regulator FadR [Mannheimia haemolytica]
AKIFFADENNRQLTLSFYRSLLCTCLAKDSEKAAACMAKNRQSSGEIWQKLSANIPESFGQL